MKPLTIFCLVAAIGTSAFLWKNGDFLRHNNEESATELPAATNSKQRTIFAGGVVEGTTREIPLNFEISGRLLSIDVSEGVRIQKGAILARLDDSVLQQDLAQADSRLALANAERKRLVNGASAETRRRVRAEAEVTAVQVEQAKLDADRALAAFKQDAITRERCDQSPILTPALGQTNYAWPMHVSNWLRRQSSKPAQ